MIQTLSLFRISAGALTGIVSVGGTAILLDTLPDLPMLPVVMILAAAYVGGFAAGTYLIVDELRR
ncbi:MAG: hypothetical protein Q8W44_00380 [Candidatus Palauibacterales bacterium]|nr:hypothetical protein [Candidatus Palauibacterales bacterium]